MREQSRRKNARQREYHRNYALKRNYGIDLEQYRAMREVQGGVCAVCRRPPFKGDLHVDHDHKTGRVRGLLCGPCNKAAGLANDDPSRLRDLAEYLEKNVLGTAG